jgi:hypothetical protein
MHQLNKCQASICDNLHSYLVQFLKFVCIAKYGYYCSLMYFAVE